MAKTFEIKSNKNGMIFTLLIAFDWAGIFMKDVSPDLHMFYIYLVHVLLCFWKLKFCKVKYTC